MDDLPSLNGDTDRPHASVLEEFFTGLKRSRIETMKHPPSGQDGL